MLSIQQSPASSSAGEEQGQDNFWISLAHDPTADLGALKLDEPINDPSEVDFRRCELRRLNGGTSGVYILLQREEGAPSKSTADAGVSGRPRLALRPKTRYRPVAVYKPASQEAGGMRDGFVAGSGVFREMAAYLLDHDHFAGVPRTFLLSVRRLGGNLMHGTKEQLLGYGTPEAKGIDIRSVTAIEYHDDTVAEQSLVRSPGHAQASLSPHEPIEDAEHVLGMEFVPNEGICEDYGSHLFKPGAVQRIALLDLRLANLDRNTGNILVSTKYATQKPLRATGDEQSGLNLIPIDHEFILPPPSVLADPDVMEDAFAWVDWPAVDVPFDADILRYILRLNVRDDIEILKAHNLPLPPNALMTLRITTMLIKVAACYHLTLRHIVDAFRRPVREEAQDGSKDSPMTHWYRDAYNQIVASFGLDTVRSSHFVPAPPNWQPDCGDLAAPDSSTASPSSLVLVSNTQDFLLPRNSPQSISPTNRSLSLPFDTHSRGMVSLSSTQPQQSKSPEDTRSWILEQYVLAYPDKPRPENFPYHVLEHLFHRLDVDSEESGLKAVDRLFLAKMGIHMIAYAASFENATPILLNSLRMNYFTICTYLWSKPRIIYDACQNPASVCFALSICFCVCVLV